MTDTTTGRTSVRLLPRFDTITYREVWDRVGAIATALHDDSSAPVRAGDFIATIGFSSPDYLTVDLASDYLGLVSVPLQHNAPVSNSGRSSPRPSPRSSRSGPSTSTSPSNRHSKAHRCAGLWFSTTGPASTTNGKASSGPRPS